MSDTNVGKRYPVPDFRQSNVHITNRGRSPMLEFEVIGRIWLGLKVVLQRSRKVIPNLMIVRFFWTFAA
jgi:hypothetical protein